VFLGDCFSESQLGRSLLELRGGLFAVKKYQVLTDGHSLRLLFHQVEFIGGESSTDIGDPRPVVEIPSIVAALRAFRMCVRCFVSFLCCSNAVVIFHLRRDTAVQMTSPLRVRARACSSSHPISSHLDRRSRRAWQTPPHRVLGSSVRWTTSGAAPHRRSPSIRRTPVPTPCARGESGDAAADVRCRWACVWPVRCCWAACRPGRAVPQTRRRCGRRRARSRSAQASRTRCCGPSRPSPPALPPRCRSCRLPQTAAMPRPCRRCSNRPRCRLWPS
jgi:hypothetical protein